MTLTSVAQENAAFDAVYPEIENLITEHVPPFAQGIALDKLHSVEGRQLIVNLLKTALTAAQGVA